MQRLNPFPAFIQMLVQYFQRISTGFFRANNPISTSVNLRPPALKYPSPRSLLFFRMKTEKSNRFFAYIQ